MSLISKTNTCGFIQSKRVLGRGYSTRFGIGKNIWVSSYLAPKDASNAIYFLVTRSSRHSSKFRRILKFRS